VGWNEKERRLQHREEAEEFYRELASITIRAPHARVDFGGANPPKRLGRKPDYEHYRSRLPPRLPTNGIYGYQPLSRVIFE